MSGSNNGKFKRGNPGGPGRPPKSRERAYLDATMSACPVEAWKAVVKRAVADARKGNAVARRWLSDILIGRDPVALTDLLGDLRGEIEEALRGRGR